MKGTYTRILVPIDGSSHSKQALNEAIEIAKRNNAHLFVVFIREGSVFGSEDVMFSEDEEAEEEESTHILKQATNQIPDAIPAEVSCLHGNHKALIIQQTVDNEIDLIVMGATGKGIIERTLVGSTTTYVVNHASCNVLVAK